MTGLLGRACLFLLAAMPVVQASAVLDPTLSDWLQDLTIPVPPGVSMSIAGIELAIRSGECRNLTLGSVRAIDNSSGPELELGVALQGLGISCSLNAYNEGDLAINVTMVDTSFELAAQVHPYVDFMTGLPIPLGGFNMTWCNMHLEIGEISASGESPIVGDLGGMDMATLNSLMFLVEDTICNDMRSIIEINGTEAALGYANLVGVFMLPPLPVAEGNITAPETLNWGTWAPVKVIRELVADRLPVWAARHLNVLDVPINRRLEIRESDESDPMLSVDVQSFKIVGLATDETPALQILANGTQVGVNTNLSSVEFTASFGISTSLPGQPALEKEMGITFGLDRAKVGARVAVNLPELREMQGEGGFHSLTCLTDLARHAASPSSDAVALTELDFAMKNGTHIEVTGPPRDALEQNVTDFVNTIIRALQTGYLPSVNALTVGAIGSFLVYPGQIDRFLWRELDNQPPCEESKEYIEESSLVGLWVTAFAAVGLGALAAAVLPPVYRYRMTKKAAREGWTPEQLRIAMRSTSSLNGANVCLAMEPQVPKWLAILYPCVLVGILFLFLYADMAVGAVVNVRMEAYGETETLGPIFAFSLINTIIHAWHAGAWLISVLTLLLSGVWPIIKLSMLFVSWVVPSDRLSSDRRGKILGFLDLAGKYSFLDSWFLVLSMSAFALEWGNESTSMKVQTLPKPAFYAFFSATVLSLMMGHLASELHRYGIRHPDPDQEPHLAHSHSVALSAFVSRTRRWVLALLILATGAVSVLACFLISFEYRMGGLGAQVLDVNTYPYSLFSVGLDVQQAGSHASGLFSLEVGFLVLCIMLPLALVVFMLVLWLVPLRRRSQHLLVHTCHLMDCWASLDVAALTLVIEAMQLGYLTQFLVESKKLKTPCTLVHDITGEDCFNVEIDLHVGFPFLIISGIAMAVVPKIVYSTCMEAIKSRDAAFIVSNKVAEKCDGLDADANATAAKAEDVNEASMDVASEEEEEEEEEKDNKTVEGGKAEGLPAASNGAAPAAAAGASPTSTATPPPSTGLAKQAEDASAADVAISVVPEDGTQTAANAVADEQVTL